MYPSHFDFSDSPFENNLDQRFLFLSDEHKEILAALLYFIKQQKAFAMICGDMGTGKTMILSWLLHNLPKHVHPIFIYNPEVSFSEVLMYIGRSLDVDLREKSSLEMTDEVRKALIRARVKGHRYVLIVDEAHLLFNESLEQVRLFSNLEDSGHRLLQILLVGQYELSHKLSCPHMRQLRQRIEVNRFLSPLDARETVNYIDHRLKVVGSDFASCFNPNCRGLLRKLTGGVPRRINQLCDNALLICKSRNEKRVSRKILKEADEALRSDLLFAPRIHERKLHSFPRRIFTPVMILYCIIALLFLGVIGYPGRLDKGVQDVLHEPVTMNVSAHPATGAETTMTGSLPGEAPSVSDMRNSYRIHEQPWGVSLNRIEPASDPSVSKIFSESPHLDENPANIASSQQLHEESFIRDLSKTP